MAVLGFEVLVLPPCVISVGDNVSLAEQTIQRNHLNQSPNGNLDLEIACPYRGAPGTITLYIHPSSRTASSELAANGAVVPAWSSRVFSC